MKTYPLGNIYYFERLGILFIDRTFRYKLGVVIVTIVSLLQGYDLLRVEART